MGFLNKWLLKWTISREDEHSVSLSFKPLGLALQVFTKLYVQYVCQEYKNKPRPSAIF